MLRSIPALFPAVLLVADRLLKPPTASALQKALLEHLDFFKHRLSLATRHGTGSDLETMPAVVILIPHDPMPRTAKLISGPCGDEGFRARLQLA